MFHTVVKLALILMEEQRLRVLQNRVMRKTFGPWEEVTGDLRKLHKEKLHDLNSSANNNTVMKTRRLRWVGHVANMGRRDMQTGFGEDLKQRNHLKGLGTERGIILKWIINKLGEHGLICLIQKKDKPLAVVNTGMNFCFAQNARNFLTSRRPVCFWRRTLLCEFY